MIFWETKFYLKEKNKSVVLFVCDKCNAEKYISAQSAKDKKYPYCHDCHQKSPERKITAKKIVKNRPNYDGENNPNFRGKTKFACPCGEDFYRRISPSQEGERFHVYCSRKCKKKYSISISKYEEYNGIKFRSSWEISLAKYFDSLSYNWKYEPEAFETSVGFYTPDFWVEDLQCYFEVKGHFRDENSKIKFNEFSKNYPIVLADEIFLKSLGFTRIKSGPQKGRLERAS
jgi:hypothetical protein